MPSEISGFRTKVALELIVEASDKFASADDAVGAVNPGDSPSQKRREGMRQWGRN